MIDRVGPNLTSSHVVFVSGKGGVGKTTIAAALALAASRAGLDVLLCEVEQRNSLAHLFGRERLHYEERRLQHNLSAMSIEPDESLVEYLRHFYGIPRISRALVTSKAVEFATQIAPGLRDILLVGKIKEADVRRDAKGGPAYDLIVVDAPPTGRLPRFLDAPRAIGELVSSGPVARQAKGVLDMTTDPSRSSVVLVTLPEELPIQETLEARAALEQIGVASGPIVCNMLWPEAEELEDATSVAAAVTASGIAEDDAAAIAELVNRSARRAREQRIALAKLEGSLGEPAIALPFLFTAEIGQSDLDVLARRLASSGRLTA